jgi:predicted dehydrogenase
MDRIGIGIIGCGVISGAYITAMRRFPDIELKAVADMQSGPAERRGFEFNIPALRTDDLLKRDDIQIVVNLTVPLAHTDVSLAVLNAGKHVHSEKPLGISYGEACKVMELAESKSLRVGCAPDTFLGGGHQTARKLIDDGAIGQPVAGSAFFMCPGHESWHPAPGFYYLRGGGPMLDMAPYYFTNLVQLLGPIASVTGSTSRLRQERCVNSAPMNGAMIPVEVQTHASGTLEFVSGAMITFAMSFDVPRHRHSPIEIYGTEASILVPDPNRFGGEVSIAKAGGEWEARPLTHGHTDGEFRSIGVADMAAAIVRNRPQRASGALALHVLEAIEAVQTSSNEGRRVTLSTTVARPAMIAPGRSDGQLD